MASREQTTRREEGQSINLSQLKAFNNATMAFVLDEQEGIWRPIGKAPLEVKTPRPRVTIAQLEDNIKELKGTIDADRHEFREVSQERNELRTQVQILSEQLSRSTPEARKLQATLQNVLLVENRLDMVVMLANTLGWSTTQIVQAATDACKRVDKRLAEKMDAEQYAVAK